MYSLTGKGDVCDELRNKMVDGFFVEDEIERKVFFDFGCGMKI